MRRGLSGERHQRPQAQQGIAAYPRLAGGWPAAFVVEDNGVGSDVAGALDRDAMRLYLGLDATGERLNPAGGLLEIESSPGEGARFELTLPAQPRAGGDSVS